MKNKASYDIIKAKRVHTLFDKVFTVYSLIVQSPYLNGDLGTVGSNHLLVVYGIIPLYKGKLLLRFFTLTYLCPNDDKTRGYGLIQGKEDFLCARCIYQKNPVMVDWGGKPLRPAIF